MKPRHESGSLEFSPTGFGLARAGAGPGPRPALDGGGTGPESRYWDWNRQGSGTWTVSKHLQLLKTTLRTAVMCLEMLK